MKMSYQALAALILLVPTVGCSESTKDPASQEPMTKHSGFTATVSGAVNGEVEGEGMVTYLPPQKQDDMVTGIRPGYFLIVNLNNLYTDSGEKEFLIALRIPDGAEPGNYPLKAPEPLKLDEGFDAWVEMKEKDRFTSYETNTEGTIILNTFSPDRTAPDTSTIEGTFQFVTENRHGDRIAANGSFEFPMKRKVASSGSDFFHQRFGGFKNMPIL